MSTTPASRPRPQRQLRRVPPPLPRRRGGRLPPRARALIALGALGLLVPTLAFARPRVSDRGIFSDLDERVEVQLPPWLSGPASELRVDKAHRTLTLYIDGVPLKSYPVALGFTPEGPKLVRGDGKTPEGPYTIVERLERDLAPRYGARSLRLSYPAPHDARRALRRGKLGRGAMRAIEEAARSGRMPPQTTILGSSIRIHGGGGGADWTAGCIALEDEDVIEVFARAPLGTKVRVLPGTRKAPDDADGDGIPDQADILLGARKTALNAAAYGTGYMKLDFPGGDVPRDQGVCTDVVIRALRNAGLDLQVLLRRDMLRHPGRYPFVERKPDPNIDQRRVRTILPWFEAHWLSLPTEPSADALGGWMPGDVVFLDTMRGPGPDHVGILSDRAGPSGLPLVINNWTHGYRTSEMDLLGSIRVTHRFRVH